MDVPTDAEAETLADTDADAKTDGAADVVDEMVTAGGDASGTGGAVDRARHAVASAAKTTTPVRTVYG